MKNIVTQALITMGFRKALEATKGCTLIHSIGKSDKTKTVLTQSEFYS